MDITWYGHSCFRLTERGGISIVTDPYSDEVGLTLSSKIKGDVLTVSRNDPAHNNIDAVKGHSYVLAGPGEYEIGGVFFTGVALHHVDDDGNIFENVAYVIQYDNINVVHLGDLRHIPKQSTIEAMGEVNVALVPAGAKAGDTAEVIAMIEPNYIIPMGYAQPGLAVELDPVDKFLKEMGVSKIEEQDSLRVTSSSLPEQPQVVVLKANE